MLHANFMVVCFIEPELGLQPIKVLYCGNAGNKGFPTFLLLWPCPWPDDLDIRTWPVFPGDIPVVQIWTAYVKAFESYRLTDRQTDTTEIIHHARRFAGGQKFCDYITLASGHLPQAASETSVVSQ